MFWERLLKNPLVDGEFGIPPSEYVYGVTPPPDWTVIVPLLYPLQLILNPPT